MYLSHNIEIKFNNGLSKAITEFAEVSNEYYMLIYTVSIAYETDL